MCGSIHRLRNAATLVAVLVPLVAGPAPAAEPPSTPAARPGRLTMTTLDRPADEEIEPRRPPRPPARAVRGQPDAKKRSIDRGVQYLVKNQRNDGGWGHGEQWNGQGAADLSNTSIAGLAVLRAGTVADVPGEKQSVTRAVKFVTTWVADSDDVKLWTPHAVDGTVQRDLGVGVDAVLAAMFLAENVAAAGEERQAAAGKDALQKLMRVITHNVRDQPNAFTNHGQALTRGLIAHTADRAARVGVDVDDDLVPMVVANRPRFNDNPHLYEAASRIGCLHTAWRRGGSSGGAAFTPIADADTPAAAAPIDVGRELDTLGRQLTAPVLANRRGQWPYGAGGEVFLALMLLTSMLQETGAESAADWSATVDARLIQTQNAGGSWSGSSCINSRVFCTSSALLVMMPTPPDGAAVVAR